MNEQKLIDVPKQCPKVYGLHRCVLPAGHETPFHRVPSHPKVKKSKPSGESQPVVNEQSKRHSDHEERL